MQLWLYQGRAEPPPGALIAPPETVTLDKWLPQAVVPRVIARHVRSEIAAPVLVPEQIVPPLAHVATAQPQVIPRRWPLANWSIAPIYTPEDPANRLASVVELAQPITTPRRLAADSYFAPEYVDEPAPTIALDWLSDSTLPTRRSLSPASSHLAAPLLPPEIIVDSWLPQLAQPVIPARRLEQPALTQLLLVPVVETETLDQWFAPLALPRWLPRLRPLGESVEPLVASPAPVVETITVDMWLPAITLPPRQPPLAPQLLSYQLIVPAPRLVSGDRVWIVNSRPTAWEDHERPSDWQPNDRRSTWEDLDR